MKFISACLVSLFSLFAIAAEAPLNSVIDIPELLENQEMRILEINLEPGQASSPHRHNAHVYVYVLEGEIEMQVRGGPIVRLKKGETFYESPSDIHQVSRNVSNTETAKFLVHMLKQAGAPATVAVDD